MLREAPTALEDFHGIEEEGSALLLDDCLASAINILVLHWSRCQATEVPSSRRAEGGIPIPAVLVPQNEKDVRS